MSYGITSYGFVRKDKATILGELRALAVSLFGASVNLSEASIFYKFLQVVAEREYELEGLAEQLYGAISISTAQGNQVDLHGADVGLKRKDGKKATVTVTFTGVPGNQIPLGTIVSSNEGYQFKTLAADEFPFIVEVTRGSTTSDQIPSPYSNLGDILWISDNQDGSDAYDEGVDYNFLDVLDTIDWSPAGDEPAADAIYYVAVDVSVDVDISCQAISSGISYNVPANTITNLESSLAGFISCDNTLAAKDGTETEDTEDYRRREMNAPRRNWTLEKIRTVVEDTDDVKSARVVWDHGISTYFLEGIDEIDLPPDFGQVFTVNDVINNISKVSLQMKRFGLPGNLTAKLYRWRGNYASSVSGPVIASTTINQRMIPTSEFDFVDFDLVATNVDSTYNYLITIASPVDANSTNYYQIKIGLGSGGGLYSSGNAISGKVAVYKTWYKSATFTTIVAPDSTYSDALESEIEDNIDKSGRAVGIQKKVKQASRVLLNLYFDIYLEEGYTYAELYDSLLDAANDYIDSLDIGDDVIHAELVKALMSVDGVANIRDLYIVANESDYNVGEDVVIYSDEMAIIGSPSLVGTVVV